jgi:hypothetical protein
LAAQWAMMSTPGSSQVKASRKVAALTRASAAASDEVAGRSVRGSWVGSVVEAQDMVGSF